VNSRIERESQWTQKHSTLTHVHQMWSNSFELGHDTEPHQDIPHEIPNVITAKKTMKDAVQTETLINWNQKVKKLTFRGDFVTLLIEEEQNVT
jgi:hypothetical protein